MPSPLAAKLKYLVRYTPYADTCLIDILNRLISQYWLFAVITHNIRSDNNLLLSVDLFVSEFCAHIFVSLKQDLGNLGRLI